MRCLYLIITNFHKKYEHVFQNNIFKKNVSKWDKAFLLSMRTIKENMNHIRFSRKNYLQII